VLRPGFTATFSVAAIGTGTLAYQWRKDGVNLPDATNTSLTVTNVQLANDGVYTVVVMDATGFVISAPASLLVLVTPQIIVPPIGQTVVAGGQVTLSCIITGNPPPFTYEWRLLSIPQYTYTSSVPIGFYTFTASSSTTVTQQYRVVVKNLAATNGVTHPTFASIIVLADTDGDGLPDEWETANGLNPGSAADANLDADGDGMSNRAEFIAGTNPGDSSSYLRVEQMSGVGGVASISFMAVSNKTYTVQCRDSLTAPWQKLADVSARTNNRVEVVIDPGPLTNRFYRLATPRLP